MREGPGIRASRMEWIGAKLVNGCTVLFQFVQPYFNMKLLKNQHFSKKNSSDFYLYTSEKPVFYRARRNQLSLRKTVNKIPIFYLKVLLRL